MPTPVHILSMAGVWHLHDFRAVHIQMARLGTAAKCSPHGAYHVALDVANVMNGWLIAHSVLSFTASCRRIGDGGVSLIDCQ